MSKTSKLEAAREMARRHFEVEPDMRHIFLLDPLNEDDPQEPIKLLEVVDGVIERWIEPVFFPADKSRMAPFPSVVVELSPREFARLKKRGSEVAFKRWSWKLGEELSR